MARRPKHPKHSVTQGFMESIAGMTYHEDIYEFSKLEQDRVESYAFDVCDDDDGEDEGGDRDIIETPSKRRRMASGTSTTSRSVIKKPKCKAFHLKHPQDVAITCLHITDTIHVDKAQLEVAAGNETNPLDLTTEEYELADPNNTWFKIAPRQNPKHSLRIASRVSEEEDVSASVKQADKSPTTGPEVSKRKRQVEAFSEEKSRQHRLSSSAHFNLVRKQRGQIREQIHAACEKARKVKERALRDAATARACLVDDGLPKARELHVLVPRSEAPSGYVDFTSVRAVAVRCFQSQKAISRHLSRTVLPMENWMGQEMGLSRDAAYVLIEAEK